MSVQIGIPRAMLHYKYFPMWHAFVEKLGGTVVLSGTTNQQIIAQGAARVVTDTCLPVKVFIGHAVSLVDRCDRIMIPVVRSTGKKVANCSRFLALPDMTKAVIPNLPPVIDIEFDANRGRYFQYQQILEAGRHMTHNPLKVREAALHAWRVHVRMRRMMAEKRLTRVDIADMIVNGTEPPETPWNDGGLTIGLIGHPYVLYDEQISHRLVRRLQSFGINVLTPEMVPQPEELDGAVPGVDGPRYWEAEEDVIDASDYYVRNHVDGIIAMMAFGCGPDSLMMHLVQRQAQEAGIPFMCLTIEEHTGEAGIVTRLEAFLDMMKLAAARRES